VYTAKDFSNEVEVRWCPGCGDHAILKHLQASLAKSDAKPHNTAIISGIGCASRLPYYMNTYGFHTIHGRAFPIASGLKLARPELDVWVITGDGDALSIGGNHYIHLFRRDIDINILLFNNMVYGLTKGQYSPTSNIGQKSKSSPNGSKEHPLNALKLALVSGASFVGRTFDKDSANIQNLFIQSKSHKGTAIVEILQNCPIFNDGIFDEFIEKSNQPSKTLRLENTRPLIFGNENQWAISLENFSPKIIASSDLNDKNTWLHDEKNKFLAELIAGFGLEGFEEFPLALGCIFRKPVAKQNHNFNDYETELKNIINRGKFEFP
jgi:2-oxoglutarate ferredoxin oxidoreductase subunit beta